MPQIFHPSMNTLSRVSIFGALFILAGAIAVGAMLVRSPYYTEAGVIREQPVPFNHKHHVGDIGIDCRYCHTSVEDSAFAGIPPTKTCMNCHGELYNDSPTLEPVRESFRTGQPLQWTRVHDLADFAYFNHSIHVSAGFACETCHGPVNKMPLMWREHSLQMRWCLDCHRNPEKYIRPRDAVFRFDWTPSPDGPSPDELIDMYDVQSKTNCSICHR
jgi:hypothetical protein